jgi:hypothetical protein
MRTILTERFKRDRTAAQAPAWAAITGELTHSAGAPVAAVVSLTGPAVEQSA